ncbi:ImmA/IrrE family metallo-endopeptidase [Acidothermaceae bacterium B102]|nr:ImmA/IrrE family metallo-endopeptidase [Acidothermaceae bacterium B102]
MGAEQAQWRPDWAVPPGDVLLEALEERQLSQAELARRMDRPVKTVNEIIKGKAAITPATALQLQRALGIDAALWTNLEASYRQSIARQQDLEALESEATFLTRFPLKDLKRLGAVPTGLGNAETLGWLLQFFGVSSPNAWRRQWAALPALRESPTFTSSVEAVASWVRLGELRAAANVTVSFDVEAFTELLREIRPWTRLTPISTVFDRVVARCAAVGVQVLLVPELAGTHLSGAAYRTDGGARVIQLSLRHKKDDHLWFTFFHEAGHLLLSPGDIFVDAETDGAAEGSEEAEAEADRFARELLIPRASLQEFLAAKRFDAASVSAFAKQEGVSVGIVVGRLQREGLVPVGSALNRLKVSVDFERRA